MACVCLRIPTPPVLASLWRAYKGLVGSVKPACTWTVYEDTDTMPTRGIRALGAFLLILPTMHSRQTEVGQYMMSVFSLVGLRATESVTILKKPDSEPITLPGLQIHAHLRAT